VATQTFTRRKKDGTIGVVTRKPYTRRSTRDDAWRYHLRELAVAEEPLRYMRRYLRVDEELVLDDEDEIGVDAPLARAPEVESVPPDPAKGISLVRPRLS
jgi:hypothetical protein